MLSDTRMAGLHPSNIVHPNDKGGLQESVPKWEHLALSPCSLTTVAFSVMAAFTTLTGKKSGPLKATVVKLHGLKATVVKLHGTPAIIHTHGTSSGGAKAGIPIALFTLGSHVC
jgi:hypothetical protein